MLWFVCLVLRVSCWLIIIGGYFSYVVAGWLIVLLRLFDFDLITCWSWMFCIGDFPCRMRLLGVVDCAYILLVICCFLFLCLVVLCCDWLVAFVEFGFDCFIFLIYSLMWWVVVRWFVLIIFDCFCIWFTYMFVVRVAFIAWFVYCVWVWVAFLGFALLGYGVCIWLLAFSLCV